MSEQQQVYRRLIERKTEADQNLFPYENGVFVAGAPMVEGMAIRAQRQQIRGCIASSLFNLNHVIQVNREDVPTSGNTAAITSFYENLKSCVTGESFSHIQFQSTTIRLLCHLLNVARHTFD